MPDTRGIHESFIREKNSLKIIKKFYLFLHILLLHK